MRALTLWQPMAWAIAENHKPVENRPWPLPEAWIGERFAVHAGKRYDEAWAQMIRERFGLEVPSRDEIALGAVIAVATFRGSLDARSLERLQIADLPHMGMRASSFEAIHAWFSGPHGFLLSDVQKLETPVPCRGMQGLWPLTEDLERQVIAGIPNPILDDDQVDALIVAQMKDVAYEAADLAIRAERKRCAAVIRARADHWRSPSGGADWVVASALELVAKEIEDS